MADTNLSKMIETALENIKKMTDVNTIIGEPIKVAGGTTVIPVSKISVGFASGGMDYTSKKAPEKDPNFGGGTGSGFTISPIGFLVVDENGIVTLLNMTNDSAAASKNDLIGTISSLVDKAPSMIDKITKIIKKDKNKEKENESDNPEIISDSVILTNEDIERIKE